MTRSPATQPGRTATPVQKPAHGHRWLLLVHQLPATPSNLRVRTWRRLQQLGAHPVKQALYVLPDTPAAREDFEWLRAEITASGGDATVFAADHVDAWSDDALIEEFRRARQEAYTALAADMGRMLGRIGTTRRPRGTRAPAVRRRIEEFRERLHAIEGVDFFGSAGRDRVVGLLRRLEASAADPQRSAPPAAAAEGADASRYQGRIWVTRPRPGVDRMATAWLVRRFIDAQARFAFAPDRESVPPDTVPFDMFGVPLSHQGDACTFETFCRTFAIAEPALDRIAAIVHDLDLKDGRSGAPEGPAIGTVIHGLQLSIADDDALLERGISLFEALYRAFELSMRPTGPRRLARPHASASRRRQPATSRRARRR